MKHSFETVPYTSSLGNTLAAFFADLVVGIPHCRALTSDEIELAVSGNERRKNRRIQPEEAIVALSGAEVVGLALYAQWRTVSLRPAGRGVVRFLGFRRGCRRAGQMLLDAVESHALADGVTSLTVFSEAFPFATCLPQVSLSNHLAHIQGLLAACGYNRRQGHVILEWPRFCAEPISATCPLDFRSETWPDEGDLPALRVTSHVHGREVGEYFSRPFRTSLAMEDAGPWLFVNDVDVIEEEQGKGYGLLTLQHGLAEASRLGYRSAIISTYENNGPALSLYSNMGFKPVDWTYDFLRTFTDKP